MLCGRAARRPHIGAQDKWHAQFTARHIVRFRRLIAELIHDQEDKIAKHQIDNRACAGHGRADRKPHKAGFGDGGVNDTACAEFLDQTGKDFERCAGFGHVFTDDEHSVVAAHFFGQCFVHGLG